MTGDLSTNDGQFSVSARTLYGAGHASAPTRDRVSLKFDVDPPEVIREAGYATAPASQTARRDFDFLLLEGF